MWSSRCCCPAGPGLHEGVAPVVDVGEDESAGRGAPHVVAVAVVDAGDDEGAGEGAPRVVAVAVVDVGEVEGAGAGAPLAVAVAVDTSLLLGSGACRQQAVAVAW